MVIWQAEFKSGLRQIEYLLWQQVWCMYVCVCVCACVCVCVSGTITVSKSFEDISPNLMASNCIDNNVQRLNIWGSVEFKVMDIMWSQAHLAKNVERTI